MRADGWPRPDSQSIIHQEWTPPRGPTPTTTPTPFGAPQPVPRAGEPVHSDPMAAHLKTDRYGDFRLTDAVRPSLDLQVVPREGYRRETYRDREQGVEVPVLAAAVSAEKLFDVFFELLQPL